MASFRTTRALLGLGLLGSAVGGALAEAQDGRHTAAPLDALGAAPLPPEWILLTSRSSAGTFLVEGYNGCSAAVPSGELTPTSGGALIQPTAIELAPCTIAFVPPTALPPGDYCILLEAGFGGLQQACFEVTGVEPVISSALLNSNGLWGEARDYASCETCDSGSGQACTRLDYRYYAQLRLEGVATEVASTHLFSWSVQQGDAEVATPLPAAPIWTPLGESLSANVYVDDWTEPFACFGLYARPIAGGASTFVARHCEPRPERFSFPDTFNLASPACDADYAARWCADNLADCTTIPELPFARCSGYAQYCNEDGSPKPLPEIEPPALEPELPEAEPDPEPVASGPRQLDSPGDAQPSTPASCSASSAPSRGWLWLVFLVLTAWSALGTRRRRR